MSKIIEDIDGRSGKTILRTICLLCEKNFAVKKRDDGLCSKCHINSLCKNLSSQKNISQIIIDKIDECKKITVINNTMNYNHTEINMHTHIMGMPKKRKESEESEETFYRPMKKLKCY